MSIEAEKQEYTALLKSHNWHFETNARWNPETFNAEWLESAAQRRRIIELSRTADPTLEIWNARAPANFKTNRPCDLQSREMAWEIFDLLKPGMADGSKRRVFQLIQNGAFLDERSEDNYPLLNLALFYNQMDIAEALILAGAPLSGVANGGYTPVLSAAHEGNTKKLTMLLEAGATIAGTTGAGHSAYDFVECRSYAAFAVLRQYEDVNTTSKARSGLVVQFRGATKDYLEKENERPHPGQNERPRSDKGDGFTLRPVRYRIITP